jgi:hypothetical protein
MAFAYCSEGGEIFLLPLRRSLGLVIGAFLSADFSR